jgi:hypothetical protein
MKCKNLRADVMKPVRYCKIINQTEVCLYCPAVKYVIAQVETERVWEIRRFKGGIVAADGLLGCDPV